MIDKQLVARRFSRAMESYDREAVAQKQIARHMDRLLDRYLPRPCNRVLEIGCGTGLLTRRLVETLRPGQLLLNDLCPDMRACFADLLAGGRAAFVAGDAERLSFPEGQDLIVSCSVVQWFARPEAFFGRCHALLAPRGSIAFSTFGKDNLKEVAAVAGGGLHYRSLEEWRRMLGPRYEVVAAGEERITVTFQTPLQVLCHLKHTGVAAVRRQAWTKGDLQAFCGEYARLFGNGGEVPLTYHPLYIIARKKNGLQPSVCKPIERT